MISVLLIRHAECDLLGKKLAGRMQGVNLNERGREQAARIALWISRDLLGGRRDLLKAVVCSPLDRAEETARPIAEITGAELRVSQGLNEIEFGDWTGKSFDEIRGLPGWEDFNQARSCNRAPRGEFMVEVQSRAVLEINALCSEFRDGAVALVSHGDVLRSLIAYYLGMPLDLIQRFELGPGSVSIMKMSARGPLLTCLNMIPHKQPLTQWI